MASTLRVDPSRLVAAAAAESDVGAFVSAMAAGQTLSGAAGGVSNLHSGAAIEFAATVIDAVGAAITAELTTHANRLTAAADTYRCTDEALGARLDHAAGEI